MQKKERKNWDPLSETIKTRCTFFWNEGKSGEKQRPGEKHEANTKDKTACSAERKNTVVWQTQAHLKREHWEHSLLDVTGRSKRAETSEEEWYRALQHIRSINLCESILSIGCCFIYGSPLGASHRQLQWLTCVRRAWRGRRLSHQHLKVLFFKGPTWKPFVWTRWDTFWHIHRLKQCLPSLTLTS